jgi:hypothetical protein
LGPLIWNTKLLALDMDGGKQLPYAKQHSTAVFSTTPCLIHTQSILLESTGDQLSDGMLLGSLDHTHM